METKLTAKDLMVGDYAKLSKGNWSEIRQLELIDIEMIAEGVYFAEAIPLTFEVLKKNGFKYNNCPIVLGWEQYGLTLYRGGDGFLINCGQNVALIINYVHQLQHTLRLCGINDKEIVL